MWISSPYTRLISLRNGVRIRSVMPQMTVSSMTYAGKVRSTPPTARAKSRRTPCRVRRASGSQNTRAASTPGTRVGRDASANTKGRTTTGGSVDVRGYRSSSTPSRSAAERSTPVSSRVSRIAVPRRSASVGSRRPPAPAWRGSRAGRTARRRAWASCEVPREPVHRPPHHLLQRGIGAGPGVAGAEAVARAIDQKQLGLAGARRVVEIASVAPRHRLVRRAMHDEPRRAHGSGGAHHVQRAGAMRFQVIEHVPVQGQLAAVARGDDAGRSGATQLFAQGRDEAAETGDGRPGDEGADALVLCRAQHGDAAARAVPEQAVSRQLKAEGALRQGIEYDVEVAQLVGVGVVPEPLGLLERVRRLTHARARKVERHHGEAGAGESLGDVRKEAPIFEAHESVAQHDARPLAARTRDVAAQRAAVGSGEPERSFRWSGQRLARAGAQ